MTEYHIRGVAKLHYMNKRKLGHASQLLSLGVLIRPITNVCKTYENKWVLL